MQKVTYLKNYKDCKAGETVQVSNNTAHFLIENGIAVLFRNYNTRMMRGVADRMMRPETKAGRRARLKREEQKYITK